MHHRHRPSPRTAAAAPASADVDGQGGRRREVGNGGILNLQGATLLADDTASSARRFSPA